MTTLRDDFNRANENPLSGGGNWAKRGEGSNFDLQVTGNECGATQFALCHGYWTPAQFGPDVEVSVKVSALPSGTDPIALYLRIQNVNTSGETCYRARYDPSGGLVIQEATARGTYTDLVSDTGFDFSAADIFTFRATGTTLEVLRNGTVVLSTTDNTITSAGYTGIAIQSIVAKLDDYSVDTLLVDSGTIYLNLDPIFVENVGAAVLLDDFNRASMGADWTIMLASSGVEIQGSDALGSSNASTRGAFFSARTFDIPLEVIGELDAVIGDSQNVGIGFGVSLTSGASWDGYWGLFASGAAGTPRAFQLLRILNGATAATLIDVRPQVTAVGDKIMLRQEANGDLILAHYVAADSHWNVLGRVNDTNLTGPFNVFVRGANTTWRVDNLQVSDPFPYTDGAVIPLTFTPSFVEDYILGNVDAGEVYLDLTPSFVEVTAFVETPTIYLDLTPGGTEFPEVAPDVATIYLDLTPSGTEYIHVCKPRFRGTLLTWLYDPDALTTDWFGGLLLPDWHGELIEVETAVNYAC